MKLRGVPGGGLVSKVALLFCVSLYFFSVSNHIAGNSSSGACLVNIVLCDISHSRDHKLENKVHFAGAEATRGGGDGGGGGGGGGVEAIKGSDRSGVASSSVHVEVRQVRPVPAGARPGPADGACGRRHRVLPHGLAVQVRRPPLRAVTRPCTPSTYSNVHN